MAEASQGRIENFSRAEVERRLRQIARRKFPRQVFDRQELAHLVQVVTNEALLLTDLYAGVPVNEILARRLPPVNPILRGLLERAAVDESSLLLFEVKRLPDQIKAIGDKCLFDVGLIGHQEHNGVSLFELGRCSYEMASEILARLAEDPHLSRFFRESGLGALPIGEEVTFLQQCSRRFPLYAEVLSGLGLAGEASASGPRARRSGEAVPVAASPAPADVAEERSTAEGLAGQVGGEALVERFPRPRPVPPGDDRLLLSREELLAAWERVLLFSVLDIENLRARLSETVVQQEAAVAAMCDEFTLFAAGTESLNHPPSYLFVGPTGVGKNHLVETLIRSLESTWEIKIPFLTLEGPNYTYPSDINELRGATRGFIRSDEEGILTEFHRRAAGAPLSVILVDEVEKAHPQLRKFFLSIMDRGTVTDNHGHVLRFPNSMIIFTSNIGYSDLACGAAPIGYGDQAAADRTFSQEVSRELRRALAPEFVNRLRIVRFDFLAPAAFERIFDLELDRITRRFAEMHRLVLEVTPVARVEILRLGTSHDHGARHLRACLERLVNVEVSRKIKGDERRRPAAPRLVGWLREMKEGKRPFDLEHVRARVTRRARARVPYRRVIVDYDGAAFEYRGVPG